MEYTRVTSVQVLGRNQLRLGFSDGSSRNVDLTGALHGSVFEPLTNPDFFAQVHVDDEMGTVVWPNGADLDPLVLHGDFEPTQGPDGRPQISLDNACSTRHLRSRGQRI